MAKYTLPRPGTLGRCLPLYFGQDFAREQRIGNPAALAAVCRGFLPAGSLCIAAPPCSHTPLLNASAAL
uniref:Uncharacterized protein n=1 Tax=Siphoviridae sp. ctMRT7 TaxID=2827855 RepID=A0A8S5SSI4_9CAUD|nr:MAG TPA: hypothetical protein [Siphoviridae sp. ctMRT7]